MPHISAERASQVPIFRAYPLIHHKYKNIYSYIFLINKFSSDETDPEYREYLANHHVDEDDAVPFWEYQIPEKLSNYLVLFILFMLILSLLFYCYLFFIIMFFIILTFFPNNLFVGYF
jgi:hypothetical protein